jgi:monofunctional biosynthetic peptidoglycan transglycosylase
VFKRLFLIAVAALLLLLVWEVVTFPDVSALAKEPPKTTAFMERRREELRDAGKSDVLEFRWVPYDRISPNLRRSVLVAEDNGFYEHKGVDAKAMREAFERDWKKGRITHGGSTITQQLAKNLYLSPSRNPLRKIREYFIARSLEKHLTKKRILEIYLNVVELGERTYGAEAGARHYFHKAASALTAREAALLAGCLPNPRIMNPGAPNKRLRWRQQMILSRLRRWGHLAEQEVLTEKKPPAPETTETTATVETGTDATTDTGSTDSTGTPDTAATAEPAGTEPTDTSGTEAPPQEPEPLDTETVSSTDTSGTR